MDSYALGLVSQWLAAEVTGVFTICPVTGEPITGEIDPVTGQVI